MVTDDFQMIILTLLGLYLVLYLYLNLKAVGCNLIHLKTILWGFFFSFSFLFFDIGDLCEFNKLTHGVMVSSLEL